MDEEYKEFAYSVRDRFEDLIRGSTLNKRDVDAFFANIDRYPGAYENVGGYLNSYSDALVARLLPLIEGKYIARIPTFFNIKRSREAIFKYVPEFRNLKSRISNDTLQKWYNMSVNNHSLEEILGDYPLVLTVLRLGERSPEYDLRLFFDTMMGNEEGRNSIYDGDAEENLFRYDLASGRSFPQFVVDALTVYPLTLNARNDMSFLGKRPFVASNITVVEKSTPFIAGLRPRVVTSKHAFPVTRYVSVTGSGFIMTSYEPKELCGSYYYYEPNSIHVLVADKFLIVRDKSQALFSLLSREEYNRVYNEGIIRDMDGRSIREKVEWLEDAIVRLQPHLPNIASYEPYDINMKLLEYAEKGIIPYDPPVMHTRSGNKYDSAASGGLLEPFDEFICEKARERKAINLSSSASLTL